MKSKHNSRTSLQIQVLKSVTYIYQIKQTINITVRFFNPYIYDLHRYVAQFASHLRGFLTRGLLLLSIVALEFFRVVKGLNTKQKKKMQQRKSTFGRPSGTDGSDYSYRMVVDSRYQLAAKGKKRLSVLFIIEALFLLVGVVFSFLPGTKADTPNTVAFYSVIASVVLLIIADIGRRRSRPSLLRLYAVLSSLVMLLFTVSLANQYSLLKAIQYISSRGGRKFDSNDFASFQIGFLVYILTLSVFKISTIKAVVFLLFNMTPPKKAS